MADATLFWKTWIQVVFPHFNNLQLRLRFMPLFLRFPCWGVGAKCACLSNFSAPTTAKIVGCSYKANGWSGHVLQVNSQWLSWMMLLVLSHEI